jgi:hypothetical protein
MEIIEAREISSEEYEDGIFVLEDPEQTREGVWVVYDDQTYARWFADRETAEKYLGRGSIGN